MLKTISQLTIRPIFLLSGDDRQQQLIESVGKRIVQVQSILQDRSFYQLVNAHLITSHHTTQVWWPEIQPLLRSHQALATHTTASRNYTRNTDEPTNDDTIDTIKKFPATTALTASRCVANRVNNIIITHAFQDQKPLAIIQCDCDMDPLPIYKDMKVMITQNRDKCRGVVNGQVATIHTVKK